LLAYPALKEYGDLNSAFLDRLRPDGVALATKSFDFSDGLFYSINRHGPHIDGGV